MRRQKTRMKRIMRKIRRGGDGRRGGERRREGRGG